MNASVTIQRQRLTFRTVNRSGHPGYDPALQRHHLLPRALTRRPWFVAMLDSLGSDLIDLDDFRRNGLLLPCKDTAAMRMGMPLHRGPHGSYNDLVGERLGQIERSWIEKRRQSPAAARQAVAMRIGLLQSALRRRLMSPGGRPLRLNRFDPRQAGDRFADLDAMAELLGSASEPSAQGAAHEW